MNRILQSSLVMLCVALPTIYACSQVPPPPPPHPHPGGRERPERPEGPEGPGGRPVQQLITIQGKVQAYTASDSTQYDGLILQSGEQNINIRFPAHMAAQLMAAAKAGSTLNIQGFYEMTPEGANVVHLVTATAGGQPVYDSPPAEPVNPPTVTMQSFDGTIAAVRLDRNGMPAGVMLSGNRLLDLPPGVYDQLQVYLKPGMTVSGTGSSAPAPAGVVLMGNVRKIHPQTINVNGQTYMVR